MNNLRRASQKYRHERKRREKRRAEKTKFYQAKMEQNRQRNLRKIAAVDYVNQLKGEIVIDE